MTRPGPQRRQELEAGRVDGEVVDRSAEVHPVAVDPHAALAAYCPVHRAQPGHLCILLDTGGALVTTGICTARMATTTLETPR